VRWTRCVCWVALELRPVAGGGFAVTMLLPLEPKGITPEPATTSPDVEREFRRANTRVQHSLLVVVLGPMAARALR
jgi:hypothetical protein